MDLLFHCCLSLCLRIALLHLICLTGVMLVLPMNAMMARVDHGLIISFVLRGVLLRSPLFKLLSLAPFFQIICLFHFYCTWIVFYCLLQIILIRFFSATLIGVMLPYITLKVSKPYSLDTLSIQSMCCGLSFC